MDILQSIYEKKHGISCRENCAIYETVGSFLNMKSSLFSLSLLSNTIRQTMDRDVGMSS